MGRKRLIWKIPCVLAATLLGIALLLLVAVTVILVTPGARNAVLRKGVAIAAERTGMEIELGRLYLSPFHQGPGLLYRAFKGREDLPLRVEIDSLFVGHRGQDTLLCLRSLRLRGCMQQAGDDAERESLAARTFVVDELLLDRATFHSDSLIAAVGIDAIVGLLQAQSPALNIAKGQYPLHGLKLADAFVGIDLRNADPDPQQDTTTTPMAFDVPDGELRNVRFVLTPLGLDIRTGVLSTNVLADVGGNRYDARQLDLRDASLTLGSLCLPFDAVYGDALVDLNANLIQSGGLSARSDAFGAKAELSTTTLDLETMRVGLRGDADFRGSKARLRGFYDIDDEAYDLRVAVEKVDLSPFLGEEHRVEVAGDLHARGAGLAPGAPSMKCNLSLQLPECIYDEINVSGLALDASVAGKTASGNLHLPVRMNDGDLRLSAETEHRFRLSDFLAPERMSVDYHTQMKQVAAHVAGEDFQIDDLALGFATDTSTALSLATRGLDIQAQSPMHVLSLLDEMQPLLGAVTDSVLVRSITSLQDLTKLDTISRLIPPLQAEILLTKGSPVQAIIERTGLDINKVALSLKAGSGQSDLTLEASLPEISHPEDSTALRLPASRLALRGCLTEGRTTASLTAGTQMTDGIMNVHGLATDASLRLDLERSGRLLNGEGHLALDSLLYEGKALGNRTADIRILPSEQYPDALRADVRLDDVPLALVKSVVQLEDIDLDGVVRVKASADGLPAETLLSAEVLPLAASATYKPYDVRLRLGETPIVIKDNNVDFNDLRIYSADSSFLALNGGLNLDKMLLDVRLAADNFSPAKLDPEGPIPVYGQLATDIRGQVTGPLDDFLADVDVTVLPTTDLTYPIDKKNLAQVKPHGTVKVQYGADGLKLAGTLNVDDGLVRYSPKLYPMMPFRVDSVSHITFNGPLGQTMLNLSASQEVKGDVQSEGEETRRVVFNTGIRVKGMLDSLGLGAIGFFLEAPNDETITRELAAMDEETREGIAAALLATGMYMGESNVAAQKNGYAFSSIINSRINAAMANSKMGKFIDVDLSSSETEHAAGKSNDMNIAISKSLFKNRMRITVGSVISDNPEVNKTNGLFSKLSVDYKLTKTGNVLLRAFSQRDYDNIFEGELNKSGIGVEATKNWKHRERSFNFTTDADIAYRSNSSIGPNLTLTQSIRNLMGHGETFTVKGLGAYYWSLRNRQPGDPKKTDTYKFGIDAALVFPYLHWGGDNTPDGDTRYRLGYKYENIAGGYGVHKFSGGFSYFIRTSPYVTHTFTPFSLSVVRVNIASQDVVDYATKHPELLKLFAGNEFVPSIGYEVTYNDYRAKRRVNTMVDFDIKEAGNLTNAIYCAFGRGWNELDKPIFRTPFNQYVRMTAELWNKFNLTDRICTATRLFAGANIPLGNSNYAPLSESFYAGGPNSLRAAESYAYGAGNFHSLKLNQNFFHAGDVKLEANVELRFPIVWKINGAVFVDAGNVWSWRNTSELLSPEDYARFVEIFGLTEPLLDGVVNNPDFAKQIALGTGAGLRLDLDGLVIRLDLGVGLHAPYQTYKYTKEGTPDLTQPINTYYNMPSALDGLRLNFGIGYPF